MKKRIALHCLIFSFIFIFGCGYATKANFLPTHIKSVYIDTFSNQTDQPNLENEFRTNLIAIVQDDGNLSISSSEDADAVLKGSLIGYNRSALRYTNDDEIREYRLTITVSFAFNDVMKNEIIVRENNLTGDATFYLSGSLATSEANARQDALADLSRRMLNKILTLW
ncbi:MAG: LptE family protein [PVC group bacterium]|nr:LptE family protein [PVC group bacterium]